MKTFVLSCAILLAITASAQQIPDINSLLNGTDINGLINSSNKCGATTNTPEFQNQVQACSTTVSPQDPCPSACKSVFNTLGSQCADLFQSLGLGISPSDCGISGPPSSPSMSDTSPPILVDNSPAPAPGANTKPIEVLTPTVAPTVPSPAEPSPSPSPSPPPSPAVALPLNTTIPNFPASCDSWLNSYMTSANFQACGQALASNPTSCPSQCTNLPKPDSTCVKDLAAWVKQFAGNTTATSSPYTGQIANNPCFSTLAASGAISACTLIAFLVTFTTALVSFL